MKNDLTPFQKAVLQVQAGTLQTYYGSMAGNNYQAPKVSYQNQDINYFAYQINVHHYYLKLMAVGIGNKQVKLKDLKNYYGLKGKTAKDVLTDFEANILK